MADPLTEMIAQSINYGLRQDNTPKASGFFGPLPTPQGNVATELSIGVNFDGQERLIPALVPTLNTDEVQHLLGGGDPTPSIVNKAVSFARGRLSSNLNPFASNEEIPYGIQLPATNKSTQWSAEQFLDSRAAAEAGLPSFLPTPSGSTARLRLQDAIARSISSGFNVPHFIGTPNEPTGDRSVSMDVENLVEALKLQEQTAIKSKNIPSLERISRERAFWENEASQGMTAEEWKAQTGEDDPLHSAFGRFPVRSPHPSELEFFKRSPNVAGMATEDNAIILNPNIQDTAQRNAVIQNEGIRLLINSIPQKPNFEITSEQRAFFKGTPYENNEQAMKETIAARIFSGDPSAQAPTEDQLNYVNFLKQQLSR